MNASVVGIALFAALALPVPAHAVLSEEAVAVEDDAANAEEPRTCREFRPTGSRARVVRACLTRDDWRRVYAYWGQGLGQIMGSVSPVPAVAPLDNPANYRSERREGRVYLEEAVEE